MSQFDKWEISQKNPELWLLWKKSSNLAKRGLNSNTKTILAVSRGCLLLLRHVLCGQQVSLLGPAILHLPASHRYLICWPANIHESGTNG